MPLIILEPHNEAQAPPDELTTLTVNYLWRRYLSDAITWYFERAIGDIDGSAEQATTLNNLYALLEDLYD